MKPGEEQGPQVEQQPAATAVLVAERETLATLQQANIHLEQMNKAKSNLISAVSHQIRTIMTSIQGFSEMIRDGNFSLKEIKEFADDINADAKRLNRLITNILDLDKIEAGNLELHFDWVDLNAIILDIVNQTRPMAPKHTFHLKLASALPVLSGDYEKLTQVVANLVDNAVKYSPAGGDILIQTFIESNLIHTTIRDHGIGIPPTDVERVFDRRAGTTAEKLHYIEGPGLGLYLVRQIVEFHGGQVWAESIMGHGSVFHFTIQFGKAPRNSDF